MVNTKHPVHSCRDCTRLHCRHSYRNSELERGSGIAVGKFYNGTGRTRHELRGFMMHTPSKDVKIEPNIVIVQTTDPKGSEKLRSWMTRRRGPLIQVELANVNYLDNVGLSYFPGDES